MKPEEDSMISDENLQSELKTEMKPPQKLGSDYRMPLDSEHLRTGKNTQTRLKCKPSKLEPSQKVMIQK